jgi:hypothetical protein
MALVQLRTSWDVRILKVLQNFAQLVAGGSAKTTAAIHEGKESLKALRMVCLAQKCIEDLFTAWLGDGLLPRLDGYKYSIDLC